LFNRLPYPFQAVLCWNGLFSIGWSKVLSRCLCILIQGWLDIVRKSWCWPIASSILFDVYPYGYCLTKWLPGFSYIFLQYSGKALCKRKLFPCDLKPVSNRLVWSADDLQQKGYSIWSFSYFCGSFDFGDGVCRGVIPFFLSGNQNDLCDCTGYFSGRDGVFFWISQGEQEKLLMEINSCNFFSLDSSRSFFWSRLF